MKSPVVKRSIVIAGHKTSVSLEDAFWKGLKEIAGTRDMTLSELVASSIPSASTAIFRRQSGCSCSIITAARSASLRTSATPRANLAAGAGAVRDVTGGLSSARSNCRASLTGCCADGANFGRMSNGFHHRCGVAGCPGAGFGCAARLSIRSDACRSRRRSGTGTTAGGAKVCGAAGGSERRGRGWRRTTGAAGGSTALLRAASSASRRLACCSTARKASQLESTATSRVRVGPPIGPLSMMPISGRPRWRRPPLPAPSASAWHRACPAARSRPASTVRSARSARTIALLNRPDRRRPRSRPRPAVR